LKQREKNKKGLLKYCGSARQSFQSAENDIHRQAKGSGAKRRSLFGIDT